MATTTNYGWTTPDDTSLVKDGASAIRSLGSSIDTTTKNLNPSTTLGDIEYRSATANTNTRLGIGTSGQCLTVVGGVPSWAASATSVLTAKGDVLTASAANTLARLGVGTDGQYLQADSSTSTGLKWGTVTAGGMTLISTINASAASTVSFTSIASTYKHLLVTWQDVTQSAAFDWFVVRLNNDSGGNYAWYGMSGNGGTISSSVGLGDSGIGNAGDGQAPILYSPTSTSGTVQRMNNGFLWLYSYAETADYSRSWSCESYSRNQANSISYGWRAKGTWASTAAIDRIDFIRSGSQTVTGKFFLYGVA